MSADTPVSLTILGSGTSFGVPMVDCDCPVCRSGDPRDRRSRPSAVFRFGERAVLVDAAPELRLQCVACGLRAVDAVLFTHHHADHIAGLDDVRQFTWRRRGTIDVYGSAATLAHLRRAFAYCFDDDPHYPSYKPALRPIEIRGSFEIAGRRIVPVPYDHGALPVLGFRVGGIAYCTDCNAMPDESRELLRGLNVLVLGAPRRRPHPTHFNLEQAIQEARQIGAGRTYFTHLGHDFPHAATNAELPGGMALAYDGLVIRDEPSAAPA